MQIDLIQPKHIYADKDEVGQIYLPTSLLTAGARLNRVGLDVTIHDENLRPLSVNSSIFGISLLGAPYIWKTIQLMKQIKESLNQEIVFLLGGQVINGLSPSQFDRLFRGYNALNGNKDYNLSKALNFDVALLPKPEETSLIPIYAKISDTDMYKYLTHEFSLYVSQGCKYSCEFCAAVRTRKDPDTGEICKVKEIYRDFEVIEKDLSYLIQRAIALGINDLKIYLSNLDVFQSPELIKNFAKICNVLKSKHSGFKLTLRGLATPESFLKARSKDRNSIIELIVAGLNTIGFGIDGMTSSVWKKIKKGHNTKDKSIEAIKIAKTEFNITPELLMTFGHNDADSVESLQDAYQFTQDMINLYSAIPRPHIAKSFIPGNDGWFNKENSNKVETLIKYPYVFQSLDFAALPTSFTHSNKEIRTLSKKYFLKLCSLEGNTTQYVKSFTPFMSKGSMRRIEDFNLNRFDR